MGEILVSSSMDYLKPQLMRAIWPPSAQHPCISLSCPVWGCFAFFMLFIGESTVLGVTGYSSLEFKFRSPLLKISWLLNVRFLSGVSIIFFYTTDLYARALAF